MKLIFVIVIILTSHTFCQSFFSKIFKKNRITPRDSSLAYADSLYRSGSFIRASYAYSDLLFEFPASVKADSVSLIIGKCLENSNYYNIARYQYERVISEHPKSPHIPEIHFRLMNIDYKQEKDLEAFQKYNEISSKYEDTPAFFDATYIAAQIRFNQSGYGAAITLLDKIPRKNSNSIYAKYTQAIAFAKREKWPNSISLFNEIITYKPRNRSEKEIIDFAKVKLAHIYFSQSEPNLIEAGQLYASIDNNSRAYTEAMIGLSWTFLKVNKPHETLLVTKVIKENSKNPILTADAYLASGYAYYMKNVLSSKNSQSNLINSARERRNAVKITEKPIISRHEFDSMEHNHKKILQSSKHTLFKYYTLINNFPTEEIISQRHQLNLELEKIEASFKSYEIFKEKLRISEIFEKSRRRILEDAEYNIMGQPGYCGIVGCGMNDGNELDDLNDLGLD